MVRNQEKVGGAKSEITRISQKNKNCNSLIEKASQEIKLKKEIESTKK